MTPYDPSDDPPPFSPFTGEDRPVADDPLHASAPDLPPDAPGAAGAAAPRLDPEGHDRAAGVEGFDAAPVVTDQGTYGEIPETLPYVDEERGWVRRSLARLAAWLLVLVATATLLVLAGWQVTSRAVATPALERAVGALTQVDELLALHHNDIVAAGASRATEPGARVEVPGFPVRGATLTAIEARDATIGTQRTLLLERAADAVYADGLGAFLAPQGAGALRPRVFSTAGATRRLLGALTAANHDRLARVLEPLGIASAALAAAVLVLGSGFGRFIAVGAAMLGAAALTFILTVLARGGVAVIGTDGTALAGEVASITRALVWTPARDAAWLAVCGVAVALPAAVASLTLRDRDAIEPEPGAQPAVRPPR